jgi:hypothetical protein
MKKRKSQKAFVNREIFIQNLIKDYDRYKIRLEKKRNLS